MKRDGVGSLLYTKTIGYKHLVHRLLIFRGGGGYKFCFGNTLQKCKIFIICVGGLQALKSVDDEKKGERYKEMS